MRSDQSVWAGPEILDNYLYFPRQWEPWAVSCTVRALTSPLFSLPSKVWSEERKTRANVGQRETSTPRSFRYGCFDNCKQTQREILGILALSYNHIIATTVLTDRQRSKSVSRYAKILEVLQCVQFYSKIWGKIFRLYGSLARRFLCIYNIGQAAVLNASS